MTPLRTARLLLMLLAFALGSAPALSAATPTPVPGGANETGGVSGDMSQVLFNGKQRIREMSLREIAPGERYAHLSPPTDGQRSIIFSLLVSNGTHHKDFGYFDASLADADGVTVAGSVLDEGWDLEPGAAARWKIGFNVPKDFVPTRIVLIKAADPKPRAFRITIRPGDFPAAAPVPTSSP